MGGTVRKVFGKKRPREQAQEPPAAEPKKPTDVDKQMAARYRVRGTGRRSLLSGSLTDREGKRTLG